MADQALDAAQYFALLEPLLPGIVDMFGPKCEVVLHDFSKPEGSIVAIAGSLTERHIGGSMSKIGLRVRAFGDDAENTYIYITRLPDGRIVRSSTMVLRAQGKVFGALCINYDITALDDAVAALSYLHSVPVTDAAPPEPVTFADDASHVLHEMIVGELGAMGRPTQRLRKAERLQLLRALKRSGAFTLQRAVPQIAEHIGVSRATIYADLRTIGTDEQRETTTSPQEGSGHGHETTGHPLLHRRGAP